MLNKTDTLSPWREMESVVYSWVYYGFLFLLFLCFCECFSSFEGHFFKFHSFWLFSYTVFKRFYTINHLIYWRFNLFGRLLRSVTTAALYYSTLKEKISRLLNFVYYTFRNLFFRNQYFYPNRCVCFWICCFFVHEIQYPFMTDSSK